MLRRRPGIDPRAGHGRGLPWARDPYEPLPQEPSLADLNFTEAEPNEPLLDEDGAVILWSD